MDNLQASHRLWAAFVEADQYIARGLQEQVSSSKAFGGDDMKPIFAAYRTLQETEPFLPNNVVEAAQIVLQVAQEELNGYLEKLRKAIAASEEEKEFAKLAVHAQNENALRRYRAALEVVKERLPKSVHSSQSQVVNNYGQIGAVGSNNRIEANSFQLVSSSLLHDVDLSRLASELHTLRSALRGAAVDVEHDQAVASVGAAELAAKGGDKDAAVKHMKAAGKWALDAATKIGVQVAAKALEASIKLP